MKRPVRETSAALVVVGVLGALIGAGSYALFDSDSSQKTTAESNTRADQPVSVTTPKNSNSQSTAGGINARQIFANSKDAVVEITVRSTNAFGGSQTAQGSGFVYDPAGYIITNEHVVDGADSISVKFGDDSSRKATLVGSDRSTDIAVIKVSGGNLKSLPLGDSNAVQVGDPVAAIGAPLGYEDTLTTGVVSALHRQLDAPNNFTIDDAIQTDAAITHGSSGGPLLNSSDQVIGVTSQIDSDSGSSEGIGFAVPSNTIKTVVDQLISTGKAEHAYLGVGIDTITPQLAKQLKIAAGVEITDVREGAPAAKAGLKGTNRTRSVGGQGYPVGGDVIVAIDGQKIATTDELQSLINAKNPGDQVKVRFVRSGHTRTVTLTLGTRPS